MTARGPHIVGFMPFANWTLHSARQVTLFQALKQRGCSVTTVLCDGVFSDCDMHQSSTDGPQHRPAKACLLCQASAAGHMATWGMPYRWLGRWLDKDDFRTAAVWAGGLPANFYPDAAYNNWPLGQWVRSSLQAHFRHDVLDLDDPRISQTYASYLYSTLLACFGLSRLYDAETPDAQITMNGRMAATRAALELARERGIRTLCEESSYVPSRMALFDNVDCRDDTPFNTLWEAWRDVPLTLAEIDTLADTVHRRWTGKSNEMEDNPPIAATTALIRDLGLDPSKPTWNGAFPNQEAWIEATNAYVTLLDRTRARSNVTAADTVVAWRFAYAFFWRHGHDFPLVEVLPSREGRMAYASPDELQTGKNESLDRICHAIMTGGLLTPTPEQRGPDIVAAEDVAIRDRLAGFAKAR